jgi:LysM repeat protein
MSIRVQRWFGGVLGVFALTLLVSAGASRGSPYEEDIGASAAATRSRIPVTARPAPRPRPTTAGVPEIRGGVSNAPVAVVAPPSAPGQPRPSFPYTIRPGDSLGSIAALFGVPVADLMRLNRLSEDSELIAGQQMRIPNPYLARERELTAEIDRLSMEKQAADDGAAKAAGTVTSLRGQLNDLTAENQSYGHDLHVLPWWRAAALMAAGAAVLMFGVMLLALIEWWILRNRFRAVAEMNESLRRLDYKYRAALAKAELRLQELYGRRRRGIQEGQERPKLPEEAEIEQLNRQLRDVLERHLKRLGPPGESARRARWRERITGIGSPVEARSLRR